MARKLKSGIIGQAQVIFGGAIRMELGWVKSARGEELAIGMAELKHPAAKAGDPIIDEETYNGTQVTLVFPGFEPLNNFRYILDLLEAELKKRIAERDAQQKIDFDDADPSHLVHEHIDPPTFEEAQGEQKIADNQFTPEQARVLDKHIDGLLEQTPAWSEEDSKRLQRIIDFLWYNRKGDTDTIYQQEQDIEWLKSLRPQSRWKPSDEQMAALMSVASGFEVTEKMKEPLKELFVELKKLREE